MAINKSGNPTIAGDSEKPQSEPLLLDRQLADVPLHSDVISRTMRADAFSLPADCDEVESELSQQSFDEQLQIVHDDWENQHNQLKDCFSHCREIFAEEVLKQQRYTDSVLSLKKNKDQEAQLKKEIFNLRTSLAEYDYEKRNFKEDIQMNMEIVGLKNKKIKELEKDQENLKDDDYQKARLFFSEELNDIARNERELIKTQEKIKELKKSNSNEGELNTLDSKLYSLEQYIKGQKDTVFFYDEQIKKTDAKIEKLEKEKNKIKVEINHFLTANNEFNQLEFCLAQYEKVISDGIFFETNNPVFQSDVKYVQLKKEENKEEQNNILNVIAKKNQDLNESYSNLIKNKIKSRTKKKKWNAKIDNFIEKRRSHILLNLQKKIMEKMNERHALLVEWYKCEQILTTAQKKTTVIHFNEADRKTKNTDELSDFIEKMHAKQEKNELNLKKITQKMDEKMKKYKRMLTAKPTELVKLKDIEKIFDENTALSERKEERDDVVQSNLHDVLSSSAEEEFISLSLPLTKQAPVFKWQPAIIANDQSYAKQNDFLAQPFKENRVLDKGIDENASLSLNLNENVQSNFYSTKYEDYLENEHINLIENEKQIVTHAAAFLKEITRIGNWYQVEYCLAFSNNDLDNQHIATLEKTLNTYFQSIFLSFRRNFSLDKTRYCKAILVLFLKSYYVAKQTDLNIIANFTEILYQWKQCEFAEQHQISSFIQELEAYTILDAPKTLAEFEQHYQNEPLYTVFFREYIGQWAGASVQVEVRSAIKIIDNDLDVKLNNDDMGANSEASSLAFKLTFSPTQEEAHKQIVFDYLQQNIQLFNMDNPDIIALLPKNTKATVRHVYSPQEQAFIQEGAVSVTGALKPFLDYYQARKTAYAEKVSAEEIFLIPEGQLYKSIQKFPLTEAEKMTQQTLKNVLEALFSASSTTPVLNCDNAKPPRNKSAFSSMAKIKQMLSTATQRLRRRKKSEKSNIIILPEAPETDILIEEKAKKGFFSNNLFNRKKQRKLEHRDKKESMKSLKSATGAGENQESSLGNKQAAKAKLCKQYNEKISTLNAGQSLMRNLTHWSTLKTNAIQRSFDCAANDEFICHITEVADGKSIGSFSAFPDKDFVQAQGENCHQLVYREMLTVLTGHEMKSEAASNKASQLIIVNVSAKMSVEKVAEVFCTVIEQGCVPCLSPESMSKLNDVMMNLDKNIRQKMGKLIDILEPDEWAEYESRLEEPVVVVSKKALSSSNLLV